VASSYDYLNHNYEEKLQMAFRRGMRIGSVILHL
jgi:hypothetical protein